MANGLGASLHDPSPAQMRTFLSALDPTDLEQGAAWLSTDDENSIEWNVDGRTVWSAPGQPVQHQLNVSVAEVVRLWCALAAGDLNAISRERWEPGNGWVETPEWRESMRIYERELDEQYWNALTRNDPTRRCEHPGCSRLQLLTSKLCRAHQFEAGRGKPCPFV